MVPVHYFLTQCTHYSCGLFSLMFNFDNVKNNHITQKLARNTGNLLYLSDCGLGCSADRTIGALHRRNTKVLCSLCNEVCSSLQLC